MRANPLVCVEVEELADPQNWATVIVSGKYEELSDSPQYEQLRELAHDLLQRQPVWWEPGYVQTVFSEKQRPMEFMYFRVHIDQISGHRGIPDTASGPKSSAEHGGPVGWLRRVLG